MVLSMSRFASITMAGALALAACGSEATIDAAKDTVPESSETTESSSTVAPATTPTTAEEPTTTTAAETTTTEASTTTAAVVEGPAGSVAFIGVDGDYTVRIGSDWVDATTELGGVTGWFTGETSADFAENVNILTSTMPSSTPLDVILTASTGEIESQFEGFDLLASDVITRPGQPDLGLLEYSALQGTVEVRFVQVFGIWDDTLVVFTGSTDGRDGNEGADRLRPYALTLAPTA